MAKKVDPYKRMQILFLAVLAVAMVLLLIFYLYRT